MALVLAGLALMATVASAQEDAVLLKLDFEEDLGGFTSADPKAELSVITTPGFALEGEGALELWYLQRAMQPQDKESGLPGSLILPTPEGLPGLKQVRFAVSAEISTPLGVILAEGGEDGPRYTALIWCEGGEWAEHQFGLDDFHYDRDSGADPDGKLTPEGIESVVIVDLGCFFRLMTEGNSMFHTVPAAEQILMLDEFELSTTEPEKAETDPETVLIQDYAWPLSGAVLLGGKSVKASPVTVDEKAEGVKVEYEIPALTIFGMVHQVRPGSLAGVQALELRVKSEKPTTLVVDLEERTGPGEERKANYNTTVQVTAGDDWQTLELPIAEFTQGEDSMDENGKLDTEDVVMLMMLEAGALMTQADVTNTLQVGGLVGVK